MKRGFTLVELLAVIIILAIISVLTVPIIYGLLNNASDKAYKKQIATIEDAAKKWGIENINKLPNNGIITIDFDILTNGDYLNVSTVNNPKTNEKLMGCIKISYNSEYNQHEYKYIDDLNECQNYNFDIDE